VGDCLFGGVNCNGTIDAGGNWCNWSKSASYGGIELELDPSVKRANSIQVLNYICGGNGAICPLHSRRRRHSRKAQRWPAPVHSERFMAVRRTRGSGPSSPCGKLAKDEASSHAACRRGGCVAARGTRAKADDAEETSLPRFVALQNGPVRAQLGTRGPIQNDSGLAQGPAGSSRGILSLR
jgi:hypothetical protein